MKHIATAAAIVLLAAPGCRREDIREMTVAIPGLAESNKAAIVAALAKYNGVVKDSYQWDLEAGTLRLRYDSMQVAQANIRYAIDEKGIAVSFPSNSTGRAGY
ncbi:MAG: hypothetical protein J6T51_03305 [Kiritimatiellae bacterium]|nr:hypothetical protein [Kiritimatiellia bacterium]